MFWWCLRPTVKQAVEGKQHPKVPGLLLAKNMLTEAEEMALLTALDNDGGDWVVRRSRITRNYGPFYLYRDGARDSSGVGHRPVPTWASGFLAHRARAAFDITDQWSVNQAHVALYRAAAKHQIRQHNDCAMGDLAHAVVGISLGAKCSMTFLHPHDRRSVVVHLPRRSAYCLTGEALSLWRHGIRAKHMRSGDRVSITLRQVDQLFVPRKLPGADSFHTSTTLATNSFPVHRHNDCAMGDTTKRVSKTTTRDSQAVSCSTVLNLETLWNMSTTVQYSIRYCTVLYCTGTVKYCILTCYSV